MMKSTSILVLAILSALSPFDSLSQQHIQHHISYIREEFKKVNNLCESITPSLYRSDTLDSKGSITFKQWKYNDRVIKFQTIRYRDQDKFVSDFYFGKNGLIFAFIQDFLRDELSNAYVRENRYYFKDDDTLIRWLDHNKEEVDPQSPRFNQQGNRIWEDMHWAGEAFWVFSSSNRPNDTNHSLDRYTIYDDRFYDIIIGQSINDFLKKLSKGMLKSGEGSFEVYYIKSDDNQELGYIIPDDRQDGKVRSIVITTPHARTIHGIKIGSTYGELKKAIPQIEVHGSEIEGRTTASFGRFRFLMDVHFYSYEIDEGKILPDTKVTAITIIGQ